MASKYAFPVLIGVFVTLVVADIMLTLVGLRVGLIELNTLFGGINSAILARVVTAAIFVGAIILLKPHRRFVADTSLKMALFVTGAVVLWNGVQIVLALVY
jgi:hypothetical protein